MFRLVIFTLTEEGDDGNEKCVAAVLNPNRSAYAVAYQNGVVLGESTDVAGLNSLCDGANTLIQKLRAQYPTYFSRGLALEMGMRVHRARNLITHAPTTHAIA